MKIPDIVYNKKFIKMCKCPMVVHLRIKVYNLSLSPIGFWNIYTVNNGYLTFKELNGIRLSLLKFFGRNITIKWNIALNKSLTAKPNEVRMGKGKGLVSQYVAIVKCYHCLFTLRFNNNSRNFGIDKSFILTILKNLPVKTFIYYNT